jgi:hypothetical protein
VPVPPRVEPAASAGATSRSAKHRLTDALSTLTSASARAPDRPTVASLCRLAAVSRNTLYRYYPGIAETVRRLRRRRGARHQARQQKTLSALRAELVALRAQLAQLATLADHYHTAAEELRALLARRDRGLAALPARARPTLAQIHRSAQGARGS